MTPLKALEEIKNAPTIYVGLASDIYTRFSYQVNVIEKSLKALEIIKEKRVNVDNFLNHIKEDTDYKEYERLDGLYIITIFSERKLTEQEYDLLKEILK